MNDDEIVEFDFRKIGTVIIIFAVIICIVGVSWWWHNYQAMQIYNKECSSNPAQHYGQECSGSENCLTACMRRLYNEQKT